MINNNHQHPHQNEVISIVCRNIKTGHEKDYDDWLRHYLKLERNAHGYLGTTVIIPGGSSLTKRYIIHRFIDKPSMEKWEQSQESIKMLEEVNKYSTKHYDTATGLETWFNLPDTNVINLPPPKWKMAIVIFIAAYIISLLSQLILQPLIGHHLPLLVNVLIYSSIMVSSLTYFAMPIMSRMLRGWLYSNPKIIQQS